MTLLNSGVVIANRYKVIDYIGAGGMQEVYRAKDIALEREVALKTPKNPSGKKRFVRSAAMSARVTHPNVAKTFDYLEEDEKQYLVEELIPGEDLKVRLASHFLTVDPHLAAHIFHHLVKGLDSVHQVGVVHRDLKPSNIMVSIDPNVANVKITDFGIAKMAEAEIQEAMKDNDEGSMLSSATVVGALPYMAPEVIQNKDNVSDRADVWSCGAILYQLLTGLRPFGDGIQAVANILAGKLPPIPVQLTNNQQFKQLAGELWDLIVGCLAPSPALRPSAKDLVERCGRLCYSTAPRFLGRVKNYKSYSGNWGFIACDGDNEQVFFHGSSCWGLPVVAGSRVSLARFSGSPQARGYPVLLLRD